MEMFRKDLMMPKMGIREVEVWETLNREYLKDKGKEKMKEKFGSKDDEEDELELDEGEWRAEGYRGLSARGRADPEKSPAKRVHSLRKVEVVIQTRKKRDRDEGEKNTETTATNPGFATLSETSRSGGTDNPKNQPAKTHEHKRQRRPTEKAQAEEKNKNKKVTTLQSSRAALDPNSATPFSSMPSHASILNQNVVPASSRFALPASTSLRTPSNALQLVSSVPHIPPSTPVANDLEPDLRLSVIKRQLEDLCSDFRYGRIDVQCALGRFDEVAMRIGRCASVASG
ncbi:hypothetical protein V5O48_015380 [Marasmius crinis-equi]|uniref:Uncharacterized protein n=1 Tax=Marasmius crinis-equi TaxID=585013 RepID=A0ABR3EUN9_9AGAR